jgi:hypothetical protein
MATPLHVDSGLLKATWTGRDYSTMAWRGCTIHAVTIGRYEDNNYLEFDDLDDTVPWDVMLLDIDYIVSRAEPVCWIAPATLAFTSASNIIATISDGDAKPRRLGLGTATTDLIMADLQRIGPEGKWDPEWHITGDGFDIRLQDPRFHLYIRAQPQPVSRPFLIAAERGKVSFEQQPYA